MSREHKYRGLTKEGKWVYGYVFKERDKAYIMKTGRLLASNENGCEEVNPLTVGEFTGKRDSKRTAKFPQGQEVCEGDKVIKDGKIYEIRHSGHGFDLATNEGNWTKREDGYSYYATSWDDIEVIGNVHQEGEQT